LEVERTAVKVHTNCGRKGCLSICDEIIYKTPLVCVTRIDITGTTAIRRPCYVIASRTGKENFVNETGISWRNTRRDELDDKKEDEDVEEDEEEDVTVEGLWAGWKPVIPNTIATRRAIIARTIATYPELLIALRSSIFFQLLCNFFHFRSKLVWLKNLTNSRD
jgi:hypothetical protein